MGGSTIPAPDYLDDLTMAEAQNWLFNKYGILVAGVDEVGRGPVSGPVVAAAVILNPQKPIAELNDSKKLTDKKRKILDPVIKEHALHWAIGEASHIEIDEINILNATFLAMRRALEQLPEWHHLAVDGNHKIREIDPDLQTPVIKGDGRVSSIAAASIIAKVYRDDLMDVLHDEYPQYNWKKNKGYPSKEQIEAIRTHGYSPYHRKTFHIKALHA
ncbi:MAG: ribonuclease HII [Fibrobacterales bacterium]